jgi:predicted negative regulator of RcsB-dependent stress response
MSESYRTEEEQVEALKNWWKESGRSILAWIVAAIIAVFGWQAWQKQQQSSQEAASAVYQNLLSAVANKEDSVTAPHLAETLRNDFSGTAYSHFAALYQAQFAVEANDLAAAESHLDWVLEQSATAEVHIQATLRLARLKYAQEKYDEALLLLETDPQGFAASYEEVKGDILRAQGNLQEAMAAYLKAQSLGLSQQVPVKNSVLLIKLQQLQSELGAQGEADNG